jgi:hypothetical protein
MTHQPPRRPRTKPTLPGIARPGGESDSNPPGAQSERPTVNPPFDVEAFARASAASPAPPSHAAAPVNAPRRRPAERPTVRPPLPDGTVPEPRAEQITLTDEVELEAARAKSAAMHPNASNTAEAEARRGRAPRQATPGPQPAARTRVSSAPSMSSALSMANARAPSAPSMQSVLSMANARAPSAPAVPAVRRPSASNIEAAVLGAISSSPGPEIVESTIDDPIAEMRERFSLGDYTGALEIAELMLAEDPGDDAAAECAESCRGVLEGMYAARLGSLDRVPSVLVQRTQLRWLSIDHRAGFVLSLIDGSSTLEMILDVCGMPRLDAIRILHELVAQKIVALKG